MTEGEGFMRRSDTVEMLAFTRTVAAEAVIMMPGTKPRAGVKAER